MTLRIVVVDDEAIARQRVIRLLEDMGGAEIVGKCAGGEAAVAQIAALEPDIVFLDVQMPDLDGFGVLQALAGRTPPAVVFVTGFDEYAVRAFEVHAVDYLLKPYDAARFREAFRRAEARAASSASCVYEGRLRALVAEYLDARGAGSRMHGLDRVAVKTDGIVRIVRTRDVDWWETDGNYVRIHVGAKAHLIRMTLTGVEAQLDASQFARIHRRYIVNLDRIAEIQPWFAGDAVIVLRSGAKLRLSRTYRLKLHAHLLGSSIGPDGELCEGG
ncbi:MAG: LytR/AlgR family response regulator transcription factor [Gemmatimonadaceae bacterium]